MNGKDFPALEAQLRRAGTFLWAETLLFGFQCFVKVTAGIIASMALLSLSGLVSLPYWSPVVAAAIGAAIMLRVIATRAPNLVEAAELVDKWSDRPDLARTCLTLPSSHSANRFVAEQAEAAARMLPSASHWPVLPVRSVALPVAIIFAGVIVMPTPRDASATDSGTALSTEATEIARQQEMGVESSRSGPASGGEETSSPGDAPPKRSNLLAVLTEEFDAPAIEIGPLGEKREGQGAAIVPSDGDGAGRGTASQETSSTRIDEVGMSDMQLRLIATGFGNGSPLEAGRPVPIRSPSQTHIAFVDPPKELLSNRLTSFAHVDRELARRYLEKRSGIR